MLTSIISISRR
ncbi:unnamed protein product [Larinioides sclopetarius]|uniref:Uncharacterized protein n=1 Tax=Larinioides sclopetarius TaxID=280406 RepID=A0AAV1Z471_9ARAC